jgi:hypothetical protein
MIEPSRAQPVRRDVVVKLAKLLFEFAQENRDLRDQNSLMKDFLNESFDLISKLPKFPGTPEELEGLVLTVAEVDLWVQILHDLALARQKISAALVG